MSEKSILLVVGHGLYEPWLDILNRGQRQTWLTWAFPDNIKVIHLHGTPVPGIGQYLDQLHERARWGSRWTALLQRNFDRILSLPFRKYIPKVTPSKLLEIEQESIHVHIPDIYFTQIWQDFAWLKFFLEETKYDFLFSTTTSSLIKPKSLSRVVSSLDFSRPIYAGFKPHPGIDFAAGNNRLLSRPAAELILSNRHKLDFGIIEDVAIGTLASKLGIPFTQLPSLHITSIPDLQEKINLIHSNFHIRVKSGSMNNRNDVKLMQEVFRIVNETGEF